MIRREVGIFIIVGTLTVLIDFMAYRSFVLLGLMGFDIAKAIGFLIGTVFAYFANRIWTFGHKSHESGSAWRFVLLYAVTLGMNVWVNALVLSMFIGKVFAVQAGFFFATGVSATLNFLGMKMFVFKVKGF